MENYQCDFCLERYEDPVQCLKCNAKFCKKHINSDNICPCCKCYTFNSKENNMINTSNLNLDLKYKCNVCGLGFGEDKNAFLIHIIDNHKEEIINYFNDKSIQNKVINQSKKAQIMSNFISINNKNTSKSNCNSINQSINNNQQINNKPKFINLPTQRNNGGRNMKKSMNQNQSMNNNINRKIYRCGKRNELIKCECCPDHICKEGNCLCVNCMKINIVQFKLSKNQLINKAGRIAEYFRGSFFCGQEYESIIDSITHRKFRNLIKCEYPSESCNDCKVLTKFCRIYYGIK